MVAHTEKPTPDGSSSGRETKKSIKGRSPAGPAGEKKYDYNIANEGRECPIKASTF